MPLEKKYEVELEEALQGCESVLDVGCGSDSPIQGFSDRIHAVGVDLHQASLEKSRARKIHREYVSADIAELPRYFQPNSFDAVLASDVIEHLSKEEGLKLLKAMESIARKMVVIFTPNGFLRQGEYDANPWQVHKSGWTPQEMQAMGYRIIGLRGWKALRGPYAAIRFYPKFFWLFISSLSQRWVRDHPQKAFQILCIKEKQSVGGK